VALRLKATWFKPTARTPAAQGNAMAFIVFRVARQALDRMRAAGFDIDAGEPYFAFLREMLVFLIQVADRMAFRRLSEPERVAFTTALALHVADTLAGNEEDLMGPPGDGEPRPRDRFIDLFNELSGHYAEFGTEGEGDALPDFAFVRYLGVRLEPLLPPKDRRWVLDQVMAAEAPEAVDVVRRGMQGLFSTAPRTPRRSALTGD
jgi:hypothetical protein